MNTNQTLEFQKILSMLSEHAVSDTAKVQLSALTPSFSERECQAKLRETTEARTVLECNGSPPLASMKELDKLLELTEKGAMLMPEQLTSLSQFLIACRRMKWYLKKAELHQVGIAYYGNEFHVLDQLSEDIERCIRNDLVSDDASPALRNIRRRLDIAGQAVKSKLDGLLRNKKNWFADTYVTRRRGRYTLPVKKEFKNQLDGTVVEASNTGGTYFIEPAAVRKLQDEIAAMEIEEENEVRTVLYTLTAQVDGVLPQLRANQKCMETLDFLFAKAKLSLQMNAIPVPVTAKRKIQLCQARHPLLERDSCVPLDFELGEDVTGIIITGPNTGGKTVALKTVGLLSLMAQCGLHIPAAAGSTLCMNGNILCDIGDGQSISENLSTFSAHLKNIIEILNNTNSESLVLLDELGSGTDPAEGMGLAIAVLEELRQRDCLFVATTHYPEIKEYAEKTSRLTNARMAFDRESLRPLYRLQIGEAGDSCALYIAKRLGFPEHLLKRARSEAYHEAYHTTPEDKVPRKLPPRKLQKDLVSPAQSDKIPAFEIGDSVTLFPQKEIGIVFQTADEKGIVGVQVQRKKQFVNHKRLKLLVPSGELYPPDYDFSILFDSVETRKARHKMEKGHHPELQITYEKED